MDSIGASTMDKTVAKQDQQRYFAEQLNMLKHQSRLSQRSVEQEKDIKKAQGRSVPSAEVNRPGNQPKYNQQQENEGVDDLASGLRQGQIKALKKQKSSKKTAVSRMTAPARMATSKALMAYWKNLIPSYGLTLFGLNFHGLGRMIMGNSFFAPYGHEWLESAKAKAGNNEAARGSIEAMGGKIGLLEKMLIFIMDFIVFVAIILVLVLLVAVAMSLEKPLWATWGFLEWLYDSIFS